MIIEASVARQNLIAGNEYLRRDLLLLGLYLQNASKRSNSYIHTIPISLIEFKNTYINILKDLGFKVETNQEVVLIILW